MNIEQARVHALDIALRMSPGAGSLQEIIKTADEITAYITAKPAALPKPDVHVWNAESIAMLKQCADDPVAFAR
ncbi:MAG: hypothetical protein EOO77_25970, partial [Oxalobacteraceae bacterium]